MINVFAKGYIGPDGLMLQAQDEYYHEKLLVKYFTGDECPIMANKVKWLNIVTSQNVRLDSNDFMRRTAIDGPGQKVTVKIPTQANFIICYSTVKGEYNIENFIL